MEFGSNFKNLRPKATELAEVRQKSYLIVLRNFFVFFAIYRLHFFLILRFDIGYCRNFGFGWRLSFMPFRLPNRNLFLQHSFEEFISSCSHAEICKFPMYEDKANAHVNTIFEP